jgi:hypothetical protein
MRETTQKPPNRRAPQKLKEEQCPARDGPDIAPCPLEGPLGSGQTGTLYQSPMTVKHSNMQSH